jgi:glycosyltransferase involved in cell wall biosynthesis
MSASKLESPPPFYVALVGHTAQMGGAEHALVRLVETLDRSLWHPVVVFAEEGPAVEKIRQLSAEAYVLPVGETLGTTRRESLSLLGCLRLSRITGLVRQVARMAAFFRARGVQLVHTNSLKAHVYAGFAARLAGIPLVWHLRDSVHESYLPIPAVRALRFLGQRLPHKVVAVSQSVARDLLGAYSPDKCAVIYDGLRDADFNSGVSSGVPDPAEPTLGMVGRITRWKGQHVFVEAAELLVRRGFSLRFEILGAPLFGEQDYWEHLHALVRKKGLENRVFFRGGVTDVGRRIRAWKAVVHASVSPDPCPNVILEAMAAGVPVVGSDGGGVPEVLGEGRFGWLHPMGNATALADALEQILRYPSKAEAISREARLHARAHFTATRVTREVEECWAKLASPGGWKKRRWPELETSGDGISRAGLTKIVSGV